MASADRIRLALPFDRAALAGWRRATPVCSPTLYTLRDAGHVRLLAELEAAGGRCPTVWTARPSSMAPRPKRPGALRRGRTTTASRMDFAAPALHRAGVAATVGKGRRSSEVRDACRATGSVYFVACGGAAAYLAKCVASSETVAYDDLGTEALRRIDVVDFPVFVGVDVRGRDVYDLV
ncbi:MAG: fumarate hydratase C-terminal domain-containing protein [Eggerthella lenta]